jgi:hypothetical protein
VVRNRLYNAIFGLQPPTAFVVMRKDVFLTFGKLLIERLPAVSEIDPVEAASI